ncbi:MULTISPECIES: hypothetical protein [Streptomyces]|uniref:hypothetical protein n=1 Tax=Streptomyces TaxID=1883 RepID=UPI00131EA269|nr:MULTISPECIES: hypothetical protein [Streptomyces]MDI5913306.1 hypothetical protein [Streptomyces sp. 12257]
MDGLHRMMLADMLTEHGLTGFTDTDRAELVSAWPCCSSTLPTPADCRSTPSGPPN